MKKTLPKLKKNAADFLSSEEGAISEKQEARVSTFLTLSGGDVLPAGDLNLSAEHCSHGSHGSW